MDCNFSSHEIMVSPLCGYQQAGDYQNCLAQSAVLARYFGVNCRKFDQVSTRNQLQEDALSAVSGSARA